MISITALRICCGDAFGTLSLTSGRITYQGQDVSTTDFERIGGRASSKKWKQSVRVINDDGTAGKLIGDWLTDRGLDIKNNKVIKLDDLSLASQDSSVVRKASVQPHSPVDVRRELATPVNSKMHTVFSGSKPMTQDPQCSAEAVVLAGPLVAPQHMPVPTVPTRPPALALAVQSCSASQQVPKLAPTSPLTAAAEAYTVQQMQQEPTQRSQADVRSATQQVSKQKLPKRMLTHVPQLQPTEASGTDLLQHLQLSYPGLIPGDSTAELPKELVNMSEDSSASSRTLIDMAAITEDELMAMSGNSADAPLCAMLPIPPGILPSREAHMTGHRPLKRQRPTIAPLSPDEAAAQIGQYMAGELKDEPWQAFGLGKAPTVAGRDLNLKQLYRAVQSFGGFASCVANRSFAKVTTKLGIDKTAMTNASFLLRNHYTKFLLAYEQQMQILASAEGAEAGSDKALLDASSWPIDSSELAAGNGSSAVEDVEVRGTAAPDEWSGEVMETEAVPVASSYGAASGGGGLEMPVAQEGVRGITTLTT
ncbi:g13386 [Coccomyxa viridis]|uniref:G13386 protein n=1 Tax=Coccomyxa viridis TaxID=1274662 RepID=A0ABP1GDL0_9CHLO